MVEEVKISASGSDLDGAILKGAATEATLQQLVRALGAKTGSAAEKLAKKNLSELTAEVKGNKKSFEEYKKKTEQAKEAIWDFGSAVISGSGKISDLTSSLTGFMATFGPGWAMLADGLQALIRLTDDQVKVFRQLSMVGADFGSSIFDSRIAAAQAGLSLDEFSGQIQQNAGTLALLGGSTNAGVRRFKNMTQEIQQNLQPTFSRLGLTMSETTDLMTDYLEVQTGLGRAQQMTDQELIDGTENYIKELDLLSRTTGMSRKEASEALKAQSKDRVLRSLMMSMDQGLQTQLQGMLATLNKTSPQIADAVKELIVTGGNPISDTAKGLMLIAPELGSMARGLKDGTVTQQEYMMAVQNAAVRAKEQNKIMGGTNALLGQMGNEMFLVGGDLAQFSEVASKRTEAEQEQAAAQQEANKTVADFSSQMTKLASNLILLFSPLFKGLELVAAGFAKVVGWLSVVTSLFAKLTESSNYVAKAFGYAAAAAMGYGAYKGGKALIGKVGGGIGSMFGGGGGGGDSKVLEGISKSGGGLGAGLKGFASGLTAFANPTVLLGAAGLAAAITLIGAGLAAATWLMGGALEKFGEGLGKIGAIDGKNLNDVAMGTLKLSGAMATFGVGGVASGFASLFGGGPESFAKNINATLDSLDKGKIDSYTVALNNLSNSFAGLNSNMSQTMTASNKTSGDKLDQLNMTMQAMLTELQTGKRYQKRTAENTEEIGI
jgi:hypothetical protein